jgi:hypothetical protein
MAQDLSVAHWLANWSEDATNITLPLASLPGLSAAEADGTTGDIRKVLFHILETIKGVWNNEAVADLPAKMTFTSGSSINDITGEITRSYTVSVITAAAAGSEEVVDE